VLLLVAPPPEPSHQGRPLSAWVRELSSPDEAEVSRALGTLAAMGPAARPALPGLIELAFEEKSDRVFVRPLTRVAIGKVGLPSPEELAARLKGAREGGTLEERLLLVRMLYLHGAAARPAKALLIEEMKKEEPRGADEPALTRKRRIAAAGAVGHIGVAALPELIEAGAQEVGRTQGSDSRHFAQAISLLGEGAVPTLARTLDGGTRDEKRFAAMALGHLGASAAGALDALRQAEASGDEDLARGASISLNQIDMYLDRLRRAVLVVGTGAAGPLPALMSATLARGRLRERARAEMRATPPPPTAERGVPRLEWKWFLLAAAGLTLGVWILVRRSYLTKHWPAGRGTESRER
jgi:hypothetical protein